MSEPKKIQPAATTRISPRGLHKVNGVIYEPYAQMYDARTEGLSNWRRRIGAPQPNDNAPNAPKEGER